MKNPHNGALVNAPHEADTVTALPIIIERLQEQGYCIGSVSKAIAGTEDKIYTRRKGELMYKKFQLDNGIRIIYERIPQFKSVSIGFWFQAGSLRNPRKTAYLIFIEHMLFKGTKKKCKANC